jgi:hypothetical protein
MLTRFDDYCVHQPPSHWHNLLRLTVIFMTVTGSTGLITLALLFLKPDSVSIRTVM